MKRKRVDEIHRRLAVAALLCCLCSRLQSPNVTALSSSTSSKYLWSIPYTVEQLQQESTNLKFVDATWYHKPGQPDPREAFEQGPRIVNSAFFDLDEIVSTSSSTNQSLSHMLPSPALLEKWMEQNGIQPGQDHLVLYGRGDCWFLPRVWFTFFAAGHTQVSILQCNDLWSEWTACGGPLETYSIRTTHILENEKSLAPPKMLSSQMNYVIGLDEMHQAVEKNGDENIILDARGSSFQKQGHIPGAIHVPYSSLSDRHNLNSIEQMEQTFVKSSLDEENPVMASSKRVICTCGSGVSACTLFLALLECGRSPESTVVYDGSWQEWGSRSDLPKVGVPETTKED